MFGMIFQVPKIFCFFRFLFPKKNRRKNFQLFWDFLKIWHFQTKIFENFWFRKKTKIFRKKSCNKKIKYFFENEKMKIFPSSLFYWILQDKLILENKVSKNFGIFLWEKKISEKKSDTSEPISWCLPENGPLSLE